MQTLHPGDDFTITPVPELCPDRAMPERMALNARLGALTPYRTAADVLAEILPGLSPKSFETLRHRTLAIGRRLEEKEPLRMFHEKLDNRERRQCELPLPADLEGEFVLSIDTANITESKRA